MRNTNISWTQVTWNPVTGCSKVSPGCAHCYAERMDKRIRAMRGEMWKPWTPENAAYNVRLHPERIKQPLHWREPRMIFVNSMSDLFHENVPQSYIDEIINVICATPRHTYQILTKRADRMQAYFTCEDMPWNAGAIQNMWLGVSVENQKQADERIPLLLQTPAAVRFLSCEPLLGEIDLSKWIAPFSVELRSHRLHWVIVGGESGPHCRAMNPEWARSLRDQCSAAGISFFFKQHSGYHPQSNTLLDGIKYHEMPNGVTA